jgi:hypothetical protein
VTTLVRNVWRVLGMSTNPTRLGRYPANSNQDAEYGAGAPTYAGNAAAGIYYVLNGAVTQHIVRVSPVDPQIESVATVKAPTVSLYSSGPPAVALGRSFYFLDPPTLTYPPGNAPPTVDGSDVLYRVTATVPVTPRVRNGGMRVRVEGFGFRMRARC